MSRSESLRTVFISRRLNRNCSFPAKFPPSLTSRVLQ
jgi:hypothetical protein